MWAWLSAFLISLHLSNWVIPAPLALLPRHFHPLGAPCCCFLPPKSPPPAKATPCKWMLDTRAHVGLSPQTLQHDCKLSSSLPSCPAASSYPSLPCQVLSKSVRNIIGIRFFCSNNVHSNLTSPPQQANKLEEGRVAIPNPRPYRALSERTAGGKGTCRTSGASLLFFRSQAVTRIATRARHLLLSSLGWGLGLGFGRVASERALGRGGGYLWGPHIPATPNSKR